MPTKDFCPSLCYITDTKKPWRACSDTLSYVVNSCQLLNNISTVGCVLTHTPHKYDITTAFIEEVEKVERKQCDNIHS